MPSSNPKMKPGQAGAVHSKNLSRTSHMFPVVRAAGLEDPIGGAGERLAVIGTKPIEELVTPVSAVPASSTPHSSSRK